MKYTVENGKIYFSSGEAMIPIDSIAVMYNKQTGTLLRHGEAKNVMGYLSQTDRLYISASGAEYADNLVVLELN